MLSHMFLLITISAFSDIDEPYSALAASSNLRIPGYIYRPRLIPMEGKRRGVFVCGERCFWYQFP